jgi:hypothetical protein
MGEQTMKSIVIALTALLVSAPLVWADEGKTEPRKGSVRVEDLPKPIPELLQKIQSLSQKIEPEISRLGSRLGEELTTAVKKLCDELQCQEKPESK